ncbi:hypothetical protein HanXRQr2_Chr15g0687511 [Helianthus annuus]|uniref:Uncharacterized protein n=1 Tax=Helianthus annuus TaxID=4232 RepID=A0A251S7R5_HELAN|nr:hypothetical protein HanXRQr2_Chr15g0687511 [Helianthus annuus]KAJ0906322.1 hypothetical protein HanPSC8_Chr07g0304211 [Helianthus annuus]
MILFSSFDQNRRFSLAGELAGGVTVVVGVKLDEQSRVRNLKALQTLVPNSNRVRVKLKVDGSEFFLGFTIRFYDYIYLFGTMFLMLNVYYYSVYIKLSIWIVFVIASHEF